MSKELKVLIWDLETAPMRAYIWGLFNQNVPYQAIEKDISILSGAWKWLGQKKVYSASILDDKEAFKKDVYNDKVVVEKLHEVLSQADILVAHNGDKFDLKMFNARCAVHGLPPIPSSIRTIDTLKASRKHFRFASNRLDFLGDRLLGERKLHTTTGLWYTIVRTDTTILEKRRAIREMVVYNKQDVILAEDYYVRIRPYMTAHPNLFVKVISDDVLCKVCGSSNLRHRGYKTTNTRVYRQWQCKECNHYTAETTMVKKEDCND